MKTITRRTLEAILILSLASFLSACGGGGGSGNDRFAGSTESDRSLMVAGTMENADAGAEGSGAVGQSVTVYRNSQVIAATDTDSDGFFEVAIPRGSFEISFGRDNKRNVVEPSADNVFLEVLYSEQNASAAIVGAQGASVSEHQQQVVEDFRPGDAIQDIGNGATGGSADKESRGDEDITLPTNQSDEQADSLIEAEGLL